MKLKLEFLEKRRLEKKGLYHIRQYITELNELLSAYEQIESHLVTPEWTWLTTNFLPAEQKRIEHARSSIPPDDIIRHAMIQGQINEIEQICNKLEDVRVQINNIRRSLELAKEVEAKLIKQDKKEINV